MNYWFLLAMLFVASSDVWAQHRYTLQSAEVSFCIRNAGFPVHGSFDSIQIDFEWSGEQNEDIELSGLLLVSTIKTGIRIRDKHLLRSDYFDVINYPTIEMKSIAVHKRSRNSYEGIFGLYIKDIDQQIPITFNLLSIGDKVLLNGSFLTNRHDFGLGIESAILSDQVHITIEASFKKLSPPDK